MPNPWPIKTYLRAKEALSRGDRKSASALLASALGSDKPTKVIDDSIDVLLNTDSLANDVALKILSTEIARNERRH